MNSITHLAHAPWFSLFLLAFGIGCVGLLPAVKPREISKGFFRFNASLGLAFFALSLAIGRIDQFDLLSHTLQNGAFETSAHLLTSAFVLGAALVTMILGHWYLISQLSFAPLIRFSKLLLTALALKAVVAGALLALNHAHVHWMEYGTPTFNALLIGVRFVVGLVAPFILSVLVLKCAKIESNQSATGILYVVVVFVLMGELASWYLTFTQGIML